VPQANCLDNGDADFALLGKIFPFMVLHALFTWGLRILLQLNGGYLGPNRNFWELVNPLVQITSWFSLLSCVLSGVAFWFSKSSEIFPFDKCMWLNLWCLGIFACLFVFLGP
jgi:hypothetical protein